MVSRSLDVYVLAKLLLEKEKRPYSIMAREIGMSASELHAAIRRLGQAGLVDPESRRPIKSRSEEFLFHGVPYAFPASLGGPTRGVPTAYAAPPLQSQLAGSDGSSIPVWPDAEGNARGFAIEPLHPSAPKAARSDPEFYEALALIDALRDGQVRGRQLAREELHRRYFSR
jgi:hypothetical protein